MRKRGRPDLDLKNFFLHAHIDHQDVSTNTHLSELQHLSFVNRTLLRRHSDTTIGPTFYVELPITSFVHAVNDVEHEAHGLNVTMRHVPAVFRLTTHRLCDVYRHLLLMEEEDMIRVPSLYLSLEMYIRRKTMSVVSKREIQQLILLFWAARNRTDHTECFCAMLASKAECRCQRMILSWQSVWANVRVQIERDRPLFAEIGAERSHTNSEKKRLDENACLLRF
jgi:hypothetical protein